jgi:density-regulated protein DRP1
MATLEPGVAPLVVAYHPITGIPEEYNDYLPKDCDEYKKLKASTSAPESAADGVEALSLKDDGDASAGGQQEVPAKEASGGKKKKKGKEPAVVIEKNARNKRKAITVVSGLDQFGVKLTEAAKMFKTKFASGCAVTKNAENKEEITCQGDFLDQAVVLILKHYGDKVGKKDIYKLEAKKRVLYFDQDDEA